MTIEKEKILISGEQIFTETFCPENEKATVVLCHGITGCRKGRTPNDSYFQDLASILTHLNYKTVLFDFSGHGDSEGNDYEVTLSKSVNELKTVFENKVNSDKPVFFLTFSYGAAVLHEFLKANENICPKGLVMYSPLLFPNEECFLNENSIFGKDIVSANNKGSLSEQGYAVVGAKGFKFGKKMIEECEGFSPDGFLKFKDNMVVFSGKNDVIINTELNDEFCDENNIPNTYFEASHSLFEEISKAFSATISFLEDKFN